MHKQIEVRLTPCRDRRLAVGQEPVKPPTAQRHALSRDHLAAQAAVQLSRDGVLEGGYGHIGRDIEIVAVDQSVVTAKGDGQLVRARRQRRLTAADLKHAHGIIRRIAASAERALRLDRRHSARKVMHLLSVEAAVGRKIDALVVGVALIAAGGLPYVEDVVAVRRQLVRFVKEIKHGHADAARHRRQQRMIDRLPIDLRAAAEQHDIMRQRPLGRFGALTDEGAEPFAEGVPVLPVKGEEAVVSVIIPNMRQPADKRPARLFLAVKDAGELDVLRAVEHRQLDQQIAHKAQHLSAGADDADPRVPIQRQPCRDPVDIPRLGDDALDKLLHGVCLHLKGLAVAAAGDVDAERLISHAHPHRQEIGVGGTLFPQSLVQLPREGHARARRGVFIGHDAALQLPHLIDPRVLLAQIDGVSLNTALQILLQLRLSALVLLAALHHLDDGGNQPRRARQHIRR